MVMLRPGKKFRKIAEKVMKGKAVKIESPKKMDKASLQGPYLQH